MLLTEYIKTNGEIVVLPNGFRLAIEETSNNVCKIDLFDSQRRSVSNHGTDLDGMIEEAIEDLKKMRK